ncbi:unnamed protein product [Thelazia callipaeda]|uniref:Uncharacterized protein n=1 Tax=Thelazia callipaeda TaxID=103827 RepID=A0A0N5CJI4_THECL|nr:unnamed protein product [Thelazia callipaeda]
MNRGSRLNFACSLHDIPPSPNCHAIVNRSSSKFSPRSGSLDTIPQVCENVIVDKEHLASICAHLCSQLKIIVDLLTDFAADVCDESESARSLLHELEEKVLPFLVKLEIEMAASEKLIRVNIDTARINETKVDWLLKFNKYELEMRDMLVILSGAIYEDLERVLSLRHRGCSGVTFKQESIACLRHMKNDTNRLHKQIKLEQMVPIY